MSKKPSGKKILASMVKSVAERTARNEAVKVRERRFTKLEQGLAKLEEKVKKLEGDVEKANYWVAKLRLDSKSQ